MQVFHDANFWGSMITIFLFAVLTVTIQMLLAIVLALLLDSPFAKGNTLFRLIYFLPYAVPNVIAGLMWGFLYSPELNPLLGLFKLFNGGKSVNLLSSNILFYSIINILLWEFIGYTMTILFANLTSIPLELYEAAKIDGCSEWKLALRIKLPLLRPTIVLLVVLSVIGTLQLFNEPYVLSSLTAVPYNFTPNLDIYNTAFSFNNLNYSATMATVLAAITILASLLLMYVTSGEERSEKRAQKRVRQWSLIDPGKEVGA
ncbi:carbohydrate ABC transporter permease [Alicyclobacillus mengziensis]|uniref:Sugar ABC transporter permease n=1 Tax=Alicyclobacillus mengziensis TaxID=2931921 RepID=A0A9X7W2S5_9BACL|nr:sugar ABC transporter permease [Alicyclobacillus mengziensis]QSO49330.1 sugar ABC transporter permease [Alicyclobacillus mengziensis]